MSNLNFWIVEREVLNFEFVTTVFINVNVKFNIAPGFAQCPLFLRPRWVPVIQQAEDLGEALVSYRVS